MDGLEEPGAGQMRQTSRVIAIGLVGGERLERLVGLPALDADHGKTQLAQPVKQDRRHSPGLEYDATTTRRFRELDRNRRRRRRRLALMNDHAFAIDDADVGLVHRDIEASKIVHVGSPLPMTPPIVAACAEELRPLPDVEKPPVVAPAFEFWGAVSAANAGRFAS